MNARCHGLTLIELLASVTLLAILAAVCVPILQRANALLRPSVASVDHVELRQLVDEVIAHRPEESRAQLDGTELSWPDAPDRPPVRVSVLSGGDETADHDWVVFECDGTTVYDWSQRPDAAEESP